MSFTCLFISLFESLFYFLLLPFSYSLSSHFTKILSIFSSFSLSLSISPFWSPSHFMFMLSLLPFHFFSHIHSFSLSLRHLHFIFPLSHTYRFSLSIFLCIFLLVPDVVAFITSQGRMKYVRPLYRALMQSKGGKEVAINTFMKYKEM